MTTPSTGIPSTARGMAAWSGAIAAVVAIALAMSCFCGSRLAHADVASASADDLQDPASAYVGQARQRVENSWRYVDGQPVATDADMTSAPSAVSLQSEGGVSAQAPAFTRKGVDVSEHNSTISWTKVASTMEFAIVRCGYGSDAVGQDDKRWLENAKGCTEAGLPMGVYIYSYATSKTAARSEALHVVRCMAAAALDATKIQLPIYLDMEDNTTADLDKKTQKAIFNQFKTTLNANGYAHVGIYSSSSWWENQLSTIELDGDYRWIASWGVSSPWQNYPSIQPAGCGVWQYSSDGSVSGISSQRVDMNYAREDWPFLESSDADVENMLRLYNPFTGEHLYTSSADECTALETLGWRYEGIAWKAPLASSVPVYRLYNKHAPGGDHHYTTSKEEYDELKERGWKGEGVAWYSAWVDQKPVYRVYNPNAYALGDSGAHHYTKSKKERDKLVKLGWEDEGVAWYGE